MKHCIGIDIGKARLDVDWLGKAAIYENQEKAIQKLIVALQALKTEEKLSLVICEATGGYEQKLVRACHEAGIPIHVAHANKVRYFAKSKGLKAKTDKIDARVLTEYARLLQPAPDTLLLNKTTEKIGELLKRREQLQSDKKREQNRLDKTLGQESSRSVGKHIRWLDNEIKTLDKKLAELKQSDLVKNDHALLTSIPSIGDITAHYLLAYLPELGSLSHKALAALVGVAPFNNESGNGKGKRFIQGGRSRLRQVLYMAAITAIRYNPPLKVFYAHLKAQGKLAKVALVAVIRKLLSMANSVMKRQTVWADEYQKI